MEEGKWKTDGVVFRYQKSRGNVAILGMEGSVARLHIPESIDGGQVTEICKKAFFNCRSLRQIWLPDSLEEVGSWAFAHCVNLERVELPWKTLRMGKDPFLGSERLGEIFLRRREEEGEKRGPGQADSAQIAPLLAAAAVRMEDPHLFSLKDAGSAGWIRRWDARMLVLLREPDASGFEKNVLTGEEDYASTDFERFVREKRKAKARLAFLRLRYSCGLPEEIRKELEAYLTEHTKGCASEESWQVLLEEYGEEPAYYRLFAGLGCVTAENLDGMLRDIGENYPEMKAYFMRYREEKLGYGDFFSSLSLDF